MKELQGGGASVLSMPYMYSMLAFDAPASTFGMVSPLKLIANSPLVALTTRKHAKTRGKEGLALNEDPSSSTNKIGPVPCTIYAPALCTHLCCLRFTGVNNLEGNPRLVPRDRDLLPLASARVHTSNNAIGKKLARD